MTADLTWSHLALVALGGSVGAVLRYLAGHLADVHDRVPWGTVAANLAGSLLLGVLTGAGLAPAALALLGVGLCGALTTYSSFVVQAHERGRWVGGLTVLLTAPPAIALFALGRLLTA